MLKPSLSSPKISFTQNIAWALTRDVNFTRIIDDLWYRDITNVEQAYIDDFGQVRTEKTQHFAKYVARLRSCEIDTWDGKKTMKFGAIFRQNDLTLSRN